MDDLLWLELLHSAFTNQLKSKDDCVILAFHCMMINKGNKCVGLGDSWDQTSDVGSDLLPEGWNSSQGNYSIRYISVPPGKKCLLKIVKANDALLINVLDVDSGKAAGMSVKVDSHIDDDFKNYSVAYKNMKKVCEEFQKEILQKIHPPDAGAQPGSAESAKPSTSTTKDNSCQHEDPNPIIDRRSRPHVLSEPERVPFPSVGRGDLDPFGGGGGGMLLDPSSMGRPRMPDIGIGGPMSLPRGAVPPGARFDPFGPPVPGRGRGGGTPFNPDPDSFPPPGFSDSFL